MSIRIHKIIGWGFNNIKATEKEGIIDERIKTDFFQSKEYRSREGDADGFLKWLKDNEQEHEELLDKVSPSESQGNSGFYVKWAIGDISNEKVKRNNHSVIYDPEYGRKETLLFTSLGDKRVYRYDDIIDYYEAGTEPEPTVKDLTPFCGIWPHTGVVHIPHAPHFGEEKYLSHYDAGEYNRMVGKWSKRTRPLLTDPEMLEYFKKWYRPVIDPTLILYVKFLDILNDFEKTIQDLRPMIYTYWS